MLLLATAGVGLLPALGRRPKVATAKPAPVWKLDLRKWEVAFARGLGSPFSATYRPPDSSCAIPQLNFLGDNVIVATNTVRAALRRGRANQLLSFNLLALFVDRATGQVLAAKAWPSSSYCAGIIPVGKTRFLTMTPDRFSLYGPGLKQLANLNIAVSTRAHGEWWDFDWSPDGKTMTIGYPDSYFHPHRVRRLWIDLDTLRVVHSWEEDAQKNIWKGPENFVVLGGCGGAVFDYETAKPFHKGLLVQKLGGPCTYVPFSRYVPSRGRFPTTQESLSPHGYWLWYSLAAGL